MRVGEFVALFLEWARSYYVRPDGTDTGTARNLEVALRWWSEREAEVESIGLRDAQAYRAALLARGLERRTANQYVSRCLRAFRWGAEEGHVPEDVPARMAVLRPLRVGSVRTWERATVTPAEVVAVAREARGRVGAMMRVQWLAGMRPGEVCRMRWDELRVEGVGMIYAPRRHKVEHLGLRRWIVLCPEAVALLGVARSGLVFPTRRGTAYSAQTYRQEVHRACDRLGVRRVRPGEIRRSAATFARALLGAEHAQRLLGHTTAAMTEHYYALGWMDQDAAVRRLLVAGWGLLNRETSA